MLEGVFGESRLNVFGISFEVGDKTGVMGERGDLMEKLELRDLLDCGLNSDVLGSDGVFCCWQTKKEREMVKLLIISMAVKRMTYNFLIINYITLLIRKSNNTQRKARCNNYIYNKINVRL